MAIDASIIGGLKPVQLENPTNALAKVLQIQGLQQEQELGRMKADEYRSGVERKNKLYSVLGQDYATPEARETALLKGGFADEALKLGKDRRDSAKADADRLKTELESHLKRFEVAGQIMSGVNDQATWDRARQITAQVFGPEAAAQMPTTYDPAQVEEKRQKAMSVKEQIEAKYKELTFGETQRHNQATESISVENNKRSVNASLANAGATREVASATRDAARIAADTKRVQDTEMKLADDYRTESKGFSETSTAMKKVFGAIETADKNPGSALAAGTAFMKILDPNSVVRESELGMALNASGWFDRATNIANTLQNGRVMTAEQKKNLKAAAEDLFEEAKAAQREIDAAYTKRATDYKLDPKRIITDRGQNAVRQKPAAAEPVKLSAANADAEFAKLPSGAEFIAPDGSRRRKP